MFVRRICRWRELGVTMKKSIAGAALALVLSIALGSGARAEKYYIDHEVWGWYQQYLRAIGNGNKPGAFAISKDGRSAFYSWCEDIHCIAGPTYSQDALNSCEREYGTDCVVFAVRDDIKVDYEIEDSGASARAVSGPSPGTTAPKPGLKIAISSEVQSDIDSYLRNAHSTGRLWAFAIAKNGTGGAMASCPSGGGWSGGGACEPVKGAPQELANREALKRCGGSDDCVLLYVGEKRAADIEIVVQ
jgi:hypothetical protein